MILKVNNHNLDKLLLTFYYKTLILKSHKTVAHESNTFHENDTRIFRGYNLSLRKSTEQTMVISRYHHTNL